MKFLHEVFVCLFLFSRQFWLVFRFSSWEYVAFQEIKLHSVTETLVSFAGYVALSLYSLPELYYTFTSAWQLVTQIVVHLSKVAGIVVS